MAAFLNFESLRARRKIFFVIVAFFVIISSRHFLVSSFALLPETAGATLSTPELTPAPEPAPEPALEPAPAPPKLSVTVCDHDPPPNWDKLYKWEDDLPQHNVDLPFPEGKEGRYVYFANQIQGLGWNNLLNEILMNTYLAYKSNRTYVFHDYIWNPDFYHWRNHPNRPGMPSTPANALLSGPSVGGPWDPFDPAPRSISKRFLDTVCPPSERHIINTRDVKPTIPNTSSGRSIFNTWQKLLLESKERCIEIQPATIEEDIFSQTFDLWFWGYGRANEFWEEYRDSPVSRLFGTSPIVSSAVERNRYLLTPRAPNGIKSIAHTVGASNDPFERMLAVHIRRGDYKEACLHFAKYNSTFYSWNLLPFLPDQFKQPVGWNVDEAETLRSYTTHCFPEMDGIRLKIRAAKEEYVLAADKEKGEVRHLDTLYILTNEKEDWLNKLKEMMYEDGWNHIVTTKDLELDQHQKDVGMVVDMDLATKAAVFIGNGWSSFTSNIVHRRLVDKKDPISIRFF